MGLGHGPEADLKVERVHPTLLPAEVRGGRALSTRAILDTTDAYARVYARV